MKMKLLFICCFIFYVQVVYSVANEGARLEIPEGPLGSLIQGYPKHNQIEDSTPCIIAVLLV